MWSRLVFILAASLLFTGCATTVKLQVQKAPAIPLPGVKAVKVEPFKVDGNLSLDLGTSNKGLLGAVATIAADAAVNKLTEGRKSEIQQEHYNGLRNAVFMNGTFQIEEKGEAVIAGSLVYNVNDEMAGVENKDKDGNVTKTYKLTRSATVKIDLHVTDKNGKLLGTSTLEQVQKATSETSSKRESRSSIASWESLVKKAVNNSHGQIVRKIAPYYVTETRVLAKSDLDIVKQGNEAADDNNWDLAVKHWNEAMKVGNNNDKAAALHNLSVNDEKDGNLKDALAKAQEASQLNPEDKYFSRVNLIQNRIKEEETLSSL